MKKKIIVIILLVLMTSSFIVKGTLKVINTSSQGNDTRETDVNTSEEKNDSEKENEIDSSVENKTDEKKDNKESSSSDEKSNLPAIDNKNNDGQVSTKPSNAENNKSDEIKDNSSNSSPSEPTSTEPKAEPKPWEAMGKTEEQYYNEPMFSWERVDFKTVEECLNYGDKSGVEIYNCRDVLSASGKYLGAMFETEKMN